MVALLTMPLFASQAHAALPLTPVPTFNTQSDENGANDQPGQKDLTLQGVATPSLNDLWTMWQWDDTGLSGGNTGDACALFDTNANSKVNFAVCVTINSNPAVQAAASPRVYTCGDGKVDRCTSTYRQITPINTACSTNTNATNPFDAGKDTQAICHIDLADVGGASSAKLVNTCSYPSQTPTSDPSDCVLIPRDAFVTITKVATPSDTTQFPFRLGLSSTAATNAVNCTTTGSGTCTSIAIRSGVPYTLKENVPTNWAIDTPTPVCTGASGTGSSNGATSGDTISGIQSTSDNTITCTYHDKKLTGAIRITKQHSGTTTTLSGAHFTIDGAGPTTTTDYVTGSDGTVCAQGLTLGSHTVAEVTAPTGYSKDPTAQTVNVGSAGTCTSGATGATFNDPVVPGTINIHKTNGSTALGGATFTLYTNVAPLAGPRGTGDTVVAGQSCTTDNTTGDCQLSSVPLGDYWVVETTTPNGYTAAADQAVTISLGTAPETGDSHTLTFVDLAAPGTVNIHKTGFGGGDLQGATFTLFTKTIGETAHGVGDTNTNKTCTTNATGDCSITDVPPGDYWAVETTTPLGYDTAGDTSVTVPLGSTAGLGATVYVTISDPVVPGSVTIHKTGINGSALGGAEFTLYNNNAPLAGPRDSTDSITTKKCTTDSSGTSAGACTISGVNPGNYWVVETVTPAGYDTAADQPLVVSIGTEAHAGDSESLTFADAVVNGKVSITKTDDAGNALSGAVFTLYTDNAPVGGTRNDTNPDPITTRTCTTAAAGTCDIINVVPGNYWVVETTTPAGYDTAADQAVAVGIGSLARTGDTVPVTLVDARQHRVVVLVCHEGTDSLLSRDVTIGGVTKQSLAPGTLTAAQQKTLCDTGGASFRNIGGHPDLTATVKLGPAH